MPLTLFFSWQSDTPAEIGSELIQKALEIAAAKLAEDVHLENAVRDSGLIVDRDTKGVGGVPPIVDTIFKKIDNAAIFIPDLTFVGTRINDRPTPNPNVLIEYGWALKTLGYTRVLPIMNVAYGQPTPETMPFDMKHLRFPEVTYNLNVGEDEIRRQRECEQLAGSLEIAIREILTSAGFRNLLPQPAAPPPFSRKVPINGEARFRAPGEPLGKSHDRRMISLTEGPAMWLRVMPASDPERSWYATELKQIAGPTLPVPLGFESFLGQDSGWVIADDGFGWYWPYSSDTTTCSCVTFLFETGEIWAVDTDSLSNRRAIPYFEPGVSTALEKYTRFLQDQLGVPPPYHWIAGIEGVKDRPIDIPLQPGSVRVLGNQPRLFYGSRGACLADKIIEEGILSDGMSATATLNPFFKKVYARCDVIRPSWMDET